MSTNIFITGLQQLQRRLQQAADANRQAALERQARDVELKVFPTPTTSSTNEPVRPIRSLLKGARPTAQRESDKRRVGATPGFGIPAIFWRAEEVIEDGFDRSVHRYVISGDGSVYADNAFTYSLVDTAFEANPYTSPAPFEFTFNSAWGAWVAGGGTWRRVRFCSRIDFTFGTISSGATYSSRLTLPGPSTSSYAVDYFEHGATVAWAKFRCEADYAGPETGFPVPRLWLFQYVTGDPGEDPNALVLDPSRNPTVDIHLECGEIQCIAYSEEFGDEHKHFKIYRATKNAVTDVTPSGSTLETNIQELFGRLGSRVEQTGGFPFPLHPSTVLPINYLGYEQGYQLEGVTYNFTLTGTDLLDPAAAPTNRVIHTYPSGVGFAPDTAWQDAAILLEQSSAMVGISYAYDVINTPEPLSYFRFSGMNNGVTTLAAPEIFQYLNNTQTYTSGDLFANEQIGSFYTLLGPLPDGYKLHAVFYERYTGEVNLGYWDASTTRTVYLFADDPVNYRTEDEPAYYYDFGDYNEPNGVPGLSATPDRLVLAMVPLASRVLNPDSGLLTNEPELCYTTTHGDDAGVTAALTALGITV